VQAARARNADVVIVDTAGRLHTRTDLMEELRKVRRVIERLDPDAPQEVLAVLDAHIGQNSAQQVKVFQEAIGLTGLVVTKMDGSARAGVVLSIEEELRVPVKLVGIGEGLDDLNRFDPAEYLRALLRMEGDDMNPVDNPQAFVKLVTAGGLPEADLWKAVLETAGITVYLRHETLASVQPVTVGGYGSVDLWVPREQAIQAMEVLQDERVTEPGEDGPVATFFFVLLVGLLGLLVLGITVAGFLWLLQFVLNNEEARLPRR